MTGKLFVVSGPSGAGKGTICQKVLSQRKDLYFSVSCTTRAPRVSRGEIDGVHYFFISEAEFLRMRDAGELLECSCHQGAWYGTPLKPALREMRAGRGVLLEIENNGAQQVMEKYPETVGVFILTADRETLIRRLVERGTEDLAKLTLRMQKVASELAAAKGYAQLILNDTVERAVQKLSDAFDGRYETGEAERLALRTMTEQFSDAEGTLRVLNDIYREYREKQSNNGGNSI